jgi:hypothetical protein
VAHCVVPGAMDQRSAAVLSKTARLNILCLSRSAAVSPHSAAEHNVFWSICRHIAALLRLSVAPRPSIDILPKMAEGTRFNGAF